MIKPIKVEIVNEVTKILNHYWVVRGIRDTGINKKCVAESEPLCVPPTDNYIANFLSKHEDVTFATVEENYKLEDIK